MVGDDAQTVSCLSARPRLTDYCPHPWTWDVDHRSPDAVVVSATDSRTVLFHPSWSNGTAGIRATKPLDANFVYYWEVPYTLSSRILSRYVHTHRAIYVLKLMAHIQSTGP